jgi:hypothetical protein
VLRKPSKSNATRDLAFKVRDFLVTNKGVCYSAYEVYQALGIKSALEKRPLLQLIKFCPDLVYRVYRNRGWISYMPALDEITRCEIRMLKRKMEEKWPEKKFTVNHGPHPLDMWRFGKVQDDVH